MNKKLYKLMKWADIEEIIYSECNHPQDLLGPHQAGGGTMLQAFFPGASGVSVKWLSADPLLGDQYANMEIADEDGYFATILPEKKVVSYTYTVTYEVKASDKKITKKTVTVGDPYRHSQIITKAQVDSFCSGELRNANKVLGSHPMSHMGEKGVHFAVWAPNALRVSVVGDFNSWDGRAHQMKLIEGGIFELFIPGNYDNCKYQYEIKLKGDRIVKRNDPYSLALTDNVSIVVPASDYKWNDSDYVNVSKKKNDKSTLIYEISANAMNSETDAIRLAKYVKAQGYNYVQINPSDVAGSMDNSSNYLYAVRPDFKVGDNLKKIVDAFHQKGVGVILSWMPSGFGRDSLGMENFDGSALYEHCDPRQGISADGRKLLFQYGCPQVISFLMSNGLYWLKEYHADGLCMSAVAQMLYLDYGKIDGAWVANCFGGNENLEAIDFIKKFITAAKKECPNVIITAEDSSTHSGMTTSAADGGMGFDFKWNEGFIGEYFDYVSFDPIERSSRHNEIVDEYIYAYSEKYILPLSAQLLLNNSGTLDLFPGNEEQRKSSLRMTLAYTYMHPGCKLIADEFDKANSKLCKELNKLFESEPAVYSTNEDPSSFEWLSNMNRNGCYISYIRKTDDPEDMLMLVANFAGIEQDIRVGVPYEGKYSEILNTDNSAFGGSGTVNPELRAIDIQADARAQSISVKLAPLSLSVLKFVPYTETELAKVIEERIRRNTPIKKKKN